MSKSRGLFAGISINGSSLDIDEKANKIFYGEDVNARTIFDAQSRNSPAETSALKETIANLFK